MIAFIKIAQFFELTDELPELTEDEKLALLTETLSEKYAAVVLSALEPEEAAEIAEGIEAGASEEPSDKKYEWVGEGNKYEGY